MKGNKMKRRLDPADRPRRQAISALSFYGFLITEYCDVHSELDALPLPSMDDGSRYLYLAWLLSDMGIYWLRDTMADWGHTMPAEIYYSLNSALSEAAERTPADYPDVFAEYDSNAALIWSGNWSPRNGIIALECLRRSYPEYYRTATKVLGGLLLHYGKYWGIPHYNGRYTHREGICEELFTTEDLEVADWELSPDAEGGYRYVGFHKGHYIKCASCGEFLHVDNDFIEFPSGKVSCMVPGVIPL